jgi:hypothetical protein
MGALQIMQDSGAGWNHEEMRELLLEYVGHQGDGGALDDFLSEDEADERDAGESIIPGGSLEQLCRYIDNQGSGEAFADFVDHAVEKDEAAGPQTAQAILEDNDQAWTEATMLLLACDFIDSLGDRPAFRRFVRSRIED